MEFGEGVHRWWCQYHLLDERSLAAMRIGLSFVSVLGSDPGLATG
jgi:hypothetical protein